MKRNLLIVLVLAAALAANAAETNAPVSSLRHRFLAEDESRAQLLLVDTSDPARNWSIKFPDRYRDVELIGRHRVLLNTGDGFREYDLRTRELVREVKDARFAGCTTARRLADGRTILGANQKTGVAFFELSATDQVRRTAQFPTLNTLRLVRLTPRGTMLLGACGNKAVEVDWDGKILRTVTVADARHIYQVLEKTDGHWLIATGYGFSIVEVDRDGQVVRRWGGAPAPAGLWLNFFAGFQVLGNGNLVVCNWTGHGADDSAKAPQLLEYSATGQLIGQWHDPRLAGSLHGIIVLDELDPNFLNDDTDSVLGPVHVLSNKRTATP